MFSITMSHALFTFQSFAFVFVLTRLVADTPGTTMTATFGFSGFMGPPLCCEGGVRARARRRIAVDLATPRLEQASGPLLGGNSAVGRTAPVGVGRPDGRAARRTWVAHRRDRVVGGRAGHRARVAGGGAAGIRKTPGVSGIHAPAGPRAERVLHRLRHVRA